MERLEILDSDQIQKKIDRLTYQIYENIVKEDSVILAGIEGTGYTFSEKIYECLSNISDQEIRLIGPCNVWGNANFKKSDFDNVKPGDEISLDLE